MRGSSTRSSTCIASLNCPALLNLLRTTFALCVSFISPTSNPLQLEKLPLDDVPNSRHTASPD
ncbi:hypothetical protein KC19_VG278500 [Ceratodon purpureus]|uniref:Uncharacterized protein n=1 Tax=Ceratodon purpureus TaxID=3225 RepID=A0A8T0HVA6_CERPU|nr:hypothetical protein KC19_VG278500 [Ceratodon purpureus]